MGAAEAAEAAAGSSAPRALTAAAAGETSAPAALNILTYNVWFEKHVQFEARARAVFDIVDRSEPDVVCLQEVLPEFVDLILHWLSESGNLREYQLSGDRESVRPYGVLMLVRAHLRPQFEFHQLPTGMARRLLTARLEVLVQRQGPTALISTHTPIVVGTVHLESLNSHPQRERQMEIARRVLEACARDSVLVGDFNFCSYRNFDERKTPLENDSLARRMPNHVDLWPLLKRSDEEPGFTFDSEVNRMIAQREQMRYDRVVANTPSWRAVDIRIVGNERIGGPPSAAEAELVPPPRDGFTTPPRRVPKQPSDTGIWPSDHFGLLARLDFREDAPLRGVGRGIS